MEPLKVGFIGAGEMATWAIYPSLHFAPISLTAICDLDANKAKSTAAKFAPGKWYTDYREMWQNENMEAVIIQMHPRPRQSIVLEALEAGYHVFIPKPPAMSLSDSEAILAAANRVRKKVMVNFERRFSYGVMEAKKIMQNSSFGPITQLFGSFCSGTYDAIRGRDYQSPVQAYILDFAVHYFDLIRYLGGEVNKIALFDHRIGGGIAITISLTFESGAVGTLQLNSQRIWWRNYDRLEITGTGEYIILDGIWSIKHYSKKGNTFTENYSDQRSGELTGDGPSLIEWASAIREDRECNSSIQDATKTMRLYQAVYNAIKNGKDGVINLP